MMISLTFLKMSFSSASLRSFDPLGVLAGELHSHEGGNERENLVHLFEWIKRMAFSSFR